jgi:hypothetical protein
MTRTVCCVLRRRGMRLHWLDNLLWTCRSGLQILLSTDGADLRPLRSYLDSTYFQTH